MLWQHSQVNCFGNHHRILPTTIIITFNLPEVFVHAALVGCVSANFLPEAPLQRAAK